MVNVLADRHHAGLFHSLELLSRRLGWTLYTPIGREWWDGGYWRFGQGYGDDRLARQFLMLAPEPDNEFPDTPIRYVSLSEAETMEWDYVIASVPDNERGFSRFADEHGARFIVQVGNTGQWVEWSLDPFVLSSSEFDPGSQGVIYHQEMDPVAYQRPTGSHYAASFVNCMPSMGRCWDLMESATIPVDVYGIDGPLNVVKPYSDLIEIMSRAAWGWHDKAQGDGFGHVLHSWAAVGRPLIGHASHYRGKLGERFWRDGETCIDLDKHSVEEACEIVRTISPADHEAMCRAILAEFEQIDYAAEAKMIAAALA
jgi:hypothetical protein